MCFKSNPVKFGRRRSTTQGDESTTVEAEQSTSSRVKEPKKIVIPPKFLEAAMDVVNNKDIVREQLEIERELKRRRENEKRIERENKRIEQQERLRNQQQDFTLEDQDLEKFEQDYFPEEERDDFDDREDDNNQVEQEESSSLFPSELKAGRKSKTRQEVATTESSSRSSSDYFSRNEDTRDKTRNKSESHEPSKREAHAKTSRKTPAYSSGRKESFSVSVKVEENPRNCSNGAASLHSRDKNSQSSRDFEAIESLINSLANHKLDIAKIEQVINAAAAASHSQNNTLLDKPDSSSNSSTEGLKSGEDKKKSEFTVKQEHDASSKGSVEDTVRNSHSSHSIPSNTNVPLTPMNQQPQAVGFPNPYMLPIQFSTMMPMMPAQQFLDPMTMMLMMQRNSLESQSTPFSNLNRWNRMSSQEDRINSNQTFNSMMKLLKEAEKRGFSSEDMDIACNSNPSNPLGE
jgi:hypothetical protein